MSKTQIQVLQMTGVMSVCVSEVTPDVDGVLTIDHKEASIIVVPDGAIIRGIRLTDDGAPWAPIVDHDHLLMIRATSTFATVHVEDAGVVSLAERIVSLGSPQPSFMIGANSVQVAYDVGLGRWRVPDWASFGEPVGGLKAYAPAAGVPPGYLECDGSVVLRAVYARLFAAIGTDYGVGDGSTTFELPTFAATPARWIIFAAM